MTAPSSGVSPAVIPRLELALRHVSSKGFKIREGRCLRGGGKHVSAPAADRAQELMEFWLDPAVAAIIPPWGGELAMELLPLLDFDRLRAAPPTWFLGYSDTSSLLFPLTLLADCATAHGTNLMEQVPGQSDPLTRGCLDVLATAPGGAVEQASSERYRNDWLDWAKHPESAFNLTEPTRWKALGGDADRRVAMRGRVIGGCLDTLTNLAGTPWGDLPAFRRRYAADGLILYLENCELIPPHFARNLWQLQAAGWFEGLAGLVFGRTLAPDAKEPDGFTFVDALEATVGRLGISVVYDADIGHVPPQMTILNGAAAELTCEGGRGILRQTLVA